VTDVDASLRFYVNRLGFTSLFISVNVELETREAAIAALDALRAELEAKGVPVNEGSWGLPAPGGR
jgi:catechol 2,3-dioxygenase-like lactoylglutathione lyase family enzyme